MSEWRGEGDALVRDTRFEDFAHAMAFANLVAETAEATNHRPDIHVHDYNHVRLTLSTHSEGGVTDKDRELAQAIDQL